MMNAQIMKQNIRQYIVAVRQQMAGEERGRLSQAIAARIASMDAYRNANTVLAYMNFGAEFAADILVQQALRDGKRVLLPRVNRSTNELDIYQVTDLLRDLAPGMWNISEPLVECCARVNTLEEVDFILMPGVAFGRDGARLGYGGGFYDKLLARLKHHPALVAGAYAMQIVEGIPQEDNDRKVEWLVTENETINCANNG
ncbi:MAG: 5-formyltetrahydrofolate cyclo-ligase [Gallionellaceae bacterium]|nr:5-formyltetrahydrofolate cyclo-ligase [Gallionellaceae bacterium]